MLTSEARVAEHFAKDVRFQNLAAPPMINADCGKKSFFLMKLLIRILRTPPGTPVPEKTFVPKLESHLLVI
ncbi:MAG: hypothetical protein H6Q48_923 [Deltaproteobacteria bacterium]|jgi:hypothetical protein|nr:hypothetical protein [Deltaproteobacteria bacterium]